MKFVSRAPWFIAAIVLLATLAPVLPAQAARRDSTTFSAHMRKVKVHRAAASTAGPATTASPQFADAPVAAATTPTASFLVTYDTGFNANPPAQAAFQAAVDVWSRLIASPVPIRVSASFADLGGGAATVLGQAGPGVLVRDFPGARIANTWYPLALAESLYGAELSTEYTEIEATFNSNPAAGF